MRRRQPPHRRRNILSICLILISLSYLTVRCESRSFVLVLSQDDLRDTINPNSPASSTEEPNNSDPDSSEWDEFGDAESKSEEELDPGSWRLVLESDTSSNKEQEESLYYSGVSKMVTAASSGGDPRLMEEATAEIEAAAKGGNPHARSVLGFLYQMGLGKERNTAKATLYHHFAAEGGNLQSKMALAHIYARQDIVGVNPVKNRPRECSNFERCLGSPNELMMRKCEFWVSKVR